MVVWRACLAWSASSRVGPVTQSLRLRRVWSRCINADSRATSLSAVNSTLVMESASGLSRSTAVGVERGVLLGNRDGNAVGSTETKPLTGMPRQRGIQGECTS